MKIKDRKKIKRNIKRVSKVKIEAYRIASIAEAYLEVLESRLTGKKLKTFDQFLKELDDEKVSGTL